MISYICIVIWYKPLLLLWTLTTDNVIPMFFENHSILCFLWIFMNKIKCLVNITLERQCCMAAKIIGSQNGTCTILIWHLLLTLYKLPQLFSIWKMGKITTHSTSLGAHIKHVYHVFYSFIFPVLLGGGRYKCIPLWWMKRQAQTM